MELVASVVPRGTADALSPTDTHWANQIGQWHCPSRFAFFVYHVKVDHVCGDLYFPGLEVQTDTAGYYVGGTLDKWDRACYALLNAKSPHDCCVIYRTIYEQLSSYGYRLSGKRSTKQRNFYLI